MTAPQSRHVMPSFTEHTSYGMKETSPYNKLFEERIVFLGTPVDDVSANDVMAQLFTLESIDPDRDISLYINSPGGSHTAMTAIYDTMQFVRCEIQTVCIGQAAGTAAVLLAAGTPGRRLALPHSRILLHQPEIEGTQGQVSDLEIQAREILRMRAQLEALFARHTGLEVAQIARDIERAHFLTAERARTYGLVDDVIVSRKTRTYAVA
jgi:ATP-dependent Clp protease protease subunit